MKTLSGRDGKKKGAWLLVLAILVATVAAGWMFLRYVAAHPLAEDAVLQADVVHISTPVPGKVMQFHVRDGARVKRGDLLISLDPAVYQLRVEQARAELDMALAALAAKRRSVQAETANAVIADEQITRARQNLELAERTYARLAPLASKGYVTRQQLDDAATLKRDAQVSLKQALSQADAARQLVGSEDAAQALVQVNRSALAIAEKSLADTRVYAPNDGLVVGLTVSEGEHLVPDQSVFTLINTESWYATALFRETDLAHIQPAACASVYFLGHPGVTVEGRVQDIGWGISTADMINLPRSLPYVQKSLNWVRVVQRFPVRIKLGPVDENLLRVGASVDVVIRHGNHC